MLERRELNVRQMRLAELVRRQRKRTFFDVNLRSWIVFSEGIEEKVMAMG